MKKLHLIILVLMAFAMQHAAAQTAADNVSMTRKGENLNIKMDIPLADLKVKSNQAVLLTPCISQGDKRLELAPVGIYGRQRYYHYLRDGQDGMIGGPEETVIRSSKMPEVQHYEASVPYQKWMEGSQLQLLRQDYGCCRNITDEQASTLVSGFSSVYRPQFLYERPQAEAVKSRALSGSAFVCFPVNRTEVRPDYMQNPRELGKITATIDSVKADKDITVKSLFIKGYASPEGSYAGNERLAKDRTLALKDYVARLYKFPANFIQTAYEAENWQGLRAYVMASSLKHKQELLAMIDSNQAPDAKESLIRDTYPDDYRTLLRDCYPGLRRSDYKVEYVIRQFSSAEEIKEVLRTQPSKLSLEEFFVAAQSMDAGSKEFDETFETAARIYPQNPTANLNAANSALKRGDTAGAAQYLSKAGNSAKAVYARAVCEAMQEHYAQALSLFQQAKAAGVSEAAAEIEKINKIK